MPTNFFKHISLVILFISLGINCKSQIVFDGSNILNNPINNNDTLFLSSKLNNSELDNNTYALVKGENGEYKLKIIDSKSVFDFEVNKNLLENSYNNNLNNYYYSSTKENDASNEIYTEESSATSSVSIIDTAFVMPQLNRTRRIWIYLPEGYSESNERYPVIYMHDGQNLFDSYTSFAGEWKVDETVDSLIRVGNKKAIIIGIDNGGRERINEYTPFPNKEYGGGDGNKYMSFIVETLKPYIDNNYRTLKDRENTSLVGSSLGGLISYYGIMKYKKTFSKAVVMSPSFWFSDKIYYIPGYNENYKIKIFFIAGDSESDSMISNINKMTDKLSKTKYPKKLYKVKIVKKGKHNEKLWGSQFADAYKWIVD